MTELQTVQRKIHLKSQAVCLIREDIKTLRSRVTLMKMKADVEKQMKSTFDPVLSRRLDAVIFLLESNQ
jgi:hypothetical protein